MSVLISQIILNYLQLNLKFWCCLIILLVIFLVALNSKTSRKVYLVDYACFKPKKSQQRTREETLALIKSHGEPNITEDAFQVQRKGIKASGIGDSTYLPEQLLTNPPDLTVEGGRKEAEAAIYSVVDTLLAKTGVKAEDIGVLIVNCTMFNPVPSLASMIVNRYKLKDNVKSFNLSGMGCCASLAAISLANQILQVHEDTNAMVVSTEIISQYIYKGLDLNKLAANCVFRVGGAATLLTNKTIGKHLSKYQLMYTVHTNTASSNSSYQCIHLIEDEQCVTGLTITKDLVVEASNIIRAHLVTVCRLILPTLDQIRWTWNWMIKRFFFANLIEVYTPDYSSVIDHLIPHVGGTMVLDELQRNITLSIEEARMTLYRFGNTSSSSVWYALAYAEAKRKIKRGDRLWQIAYGSGFKCNSVIWYALRDINIEKNNPWEEEICDFPLNLEVFEESPLIFEAPN